MGSFITITELPLDNVPAGNLMFVIEWRKASDPDEAASYTLAPVLTVDPNGNVISPSPYKIAVPDTPIVVRATNINGCAPGITKEFFICEPVVITADFGDRFTTTLSYNVFTGNVLQPAGPDAMTTATVGVEKISNTTLKYYELAGPIAISMVLPMEGVNPGDLCPYIFSANITILTNVYDTGDNSYHITATIPGDQSNNISVHLPAFVTRINIDGVHLGPAYTVFLEGAYYWEALIAPSIYNLGFGYRFCTLVRIRFTRIPVISGVFANDYNIPAGLTITSAVISGGYYVVEVSFSGQSNHLFNITSNP